MDIIKIQAEQRECLRLRNEGLNNPQIAQCLGLSIDQVRRRIKGGKKAERLDPAIREALAKRGVVDLAGLHSGWIMERGDDGSGTSLFFYTGPDEEKIDFAEAVRDVLQEIPRLDPLPAVQSQANGYANWIALADLHIGSHYGDESIVTDLHVAIDDLVSRMPRAEKAVLIELGDLLDANDHRGVTPARENPLDVVRNNPLHNTMVAVDALRRVILRLAETHPEVEVHLIPGNHDPTSYIAVLLALDAHFAAVPSVNIVIHHDDFRVISWGHCAAFPHHGHDMKWEALKDVFSDQFPDEWAAAKMHRLIMTAHWHHDRRRDMIGATGEHFRTLHRANKWAKSKGYFSRGSLTAMTVHKDRGEEYRVTSNLMPRLRGA